MDIEKRQITTGEQYTDFVIKFVTLLDQELLVLEERIKNKKRYSQCCTANASDNLSSYTVGYLRGQDGIFLEIRPMTENQREFYKFEDLFEDRLNKIIELILDSEEKDFYIKRLESYLVKVLTGQKADVIW